MKLKFESGCLLRAFVDECFESIINKQKLYPSIHLIYMS